MAQKTTVTLVSDLSGKDIEEGGQTVDFALDGVSYEIDLDEAEANELRDQLAVYIENGRRTGGRRNGRASRVAASSTTPASAATKASAGTTSAEREENKKIRVWAKENGYQVSDRGRIPGEVSEAYRKTA